MCWALQNSTFKAVSNYHRKKSLSLHLQNSELDLSRSTLVTFWLASADICTAVYERARELLGARTSDMNI